MSTPDQAGLQVVGVMQKMMQEVSQAIQRAQMQLGQVEVSRARVADERAPRAYSDPYTRCLAGAHRGRNRSRYFRAEVRALRNEARKLLFLHPSLPPPS